jgi:pimeloyl-ACP methyl ester carboxylesterase
MTGDPGSGTGTDGCVTLPGGRRLHYWAGGSPGGPAVVFLPGCPDSRLIARSGDEAARRAGVRLIAVNRPGYGRSDPAASGHLSVADEVAALADSLGLDRFAVLGMSLGGPYALACAVRHPHRVTAAGLVAAPANVPALNPPAHRDNLTADQQAFLARLAGLSPAAAAELMRPDYRRYVADLRADDPDDHALAGRWTHGAHPRDAAALARLSDADLAAGAREAVAHADGYLRDAAAAFRRWEFAPERVRCPVRLWYGAQDPQASPRNGAWLARHVPSAVLVVRPDTAHLSTLLDHWPEILTTLTAE